MNERLVSRAHGASTTKIRARVESCRRPDARRANRGRATSRARRNKFVSLSRAHHVREIHPHRQRSICIGIVPNPFACSLSDTRRRGSNPWLELEPLPRIRLEVGVGDAKILDGVEDFLEHRPWASRASNMVGPVRESRDGATDAISKSIARDGPRVRMRRRCRHGRQRRETRDDLGCDTQNKN